MPARRSDRPRPRRAPLEAAAARAGLLGALAAVLMAGCNCGGSAGHDGGSGGGSGGGFAGTGGGGGSQAADCGWETRAGATSSTLLSGLIALPDDSVVGVGISASIPDSGVMGGAWAFRLDKQGRPLWNRSYGAATTITHAALGADSTTLVLAGVAQSDAGCANHHGVKDAWVARVQLSGGELMFSTCVGGDDDEEVTAVRDRGGVVELLGTSDSHQSGDIGDKWGGGGFDSPDGLIAFVGSGGVTTYLRGTRGPDSLNGWLEDGSLAGNTFGDNSGDLAGESIAPAYSDMMFLTVGSGLACDETACSTVTTGGVGPHLHRNHRGPGTHPVGSGQISAGTDSASGAQGRSARR